MINKAKQRGFTIVELIFALWALFCVGMLGVVIFVVWHFVSKLW